MAWFRRIQKTIPIFRDGFFAVGEKEWLRGHKHKTAHDCMAIRTPSIASFKFHPHQQKKAIPKNRNSFFCGEGGIRTPGPVKVNGFQDRRNRPLCHLSDRFRFSVKAVAKLGVLLESQNLLNKKIIKKFIPHGKNLIARVET